MLRDGHMARARRAEPVQRRAATRVLGVATTLLLHGLIAFWLLFEPRLLQQEAPAALPPLQVRMITAATAPALPAVPLRFTPPPPQQLSRQGPVLVLEGSTILTEPMPRNETTASATQTAMAAPAFRRSREGLNPDCLPRGWLLQMSQLINFSLRYPAQARQLGAMGTAYVRVSVARDGRVQEARLLQSSGNGSLDSEAQDVIRRISRFAPVPQARCAGYDIIVVDQPIRFAGG